jgi:3-methyladenine DNA glycosylase/8-oxoguanine DNA glycosylase
MVLKTKKDIEQAITFLSKKDPKMKTLINHFGLPKRRNYTSYFEALTRAIIYQQLSGKVAMKIEERFVGLYKDDGYPTPDIVAKTTIKKLRTAGLSERKAGFIKGIADSFINDKWTPAKISRLSDDDVKERLVQLKGIGPWTADMFLMGSLRRSDILPIGDYGIKRGFQFLFNLRELPTDDYMIKKAKPWQPFRSVASYYLWGMANEGINFSKFFSKKGNKA